MHQSSRILRGAHQPCLSCGGGLGGVLGGGLGGGLGGVLGGVLGVERALPNDSVAKEARTKQSNHHLPGTDCRRRGDEEGPLGTY